MTGAPRSATIRWPALPPPCGPCPGRSPVADAKGAPGDPPPRGPSPTAPPLPPTARGVARRRARRPTTRAMRSPTIRRHGITSETRPGGATGTLVPRAPAPHARRRGRRARRGDRPLVGGRHARGDRLHARRHRVPAGPGRPRARLPGPGRRYRPDRLPHTAGPHHRSRGARPDRAGPRAGGATAARCDGHQSLRARRKRGDLARSPHRLRHRDLRRAGGRPAEGRHRARDLDRSQGRVAGPSGGARRRGDRAGEDDVAGIGDGHRPRRGDRRPPARVRVAARGRPADRDGGARARHRVRRHRARLAGDQDARLLHRASGDDRPRRRHRLCPVHRHPLPREPSRRRGGRAGDDRRHGHRRPRRAVGRQHGHHRAARHARAGRELPRRPGRRVGDRRAAHDACGADDAAGAPRVLRRARRARRPPARGAGAWRVLGPLGAGRPSPPVGGRGRRAGDHARLRGARPVDAVGLRRRRQRPRRHHDAAGLRPARARLRPRLQRPAHDRRRAAAGARMRRR